MEVVAGDARLYGAMAWIRDNTPEDAVIAVNNEEGLEFGYAAFTERRTFLGGWAYSDKASLRTSSDLEGIEENPFPDRLALNEAGVPATHRRRARGPAA